MLGGAARGGSGSKRQSTSFVAQPALCGVLAGAAAGADAGAAGAVGTAAAGIGAAVNSDIELKENIRRVGDYDDNLGWYEWDWNEKAKEIGVEAEPTAGFLAQEVLEVEPDAVSIKNGYYAVDYARLMK